MLIPGVMAQEAPTPPGNNVDHRPAIALTLPRAIEMAMQHNRHLRLAQLATAESREKHTIARSHYYPHITNQSTSIYLTALQGVVVPAGTFGNSAITGPIPSQTLRLEQGALTAYTSGTGLEQPLTQYFKIHAGDRAAEADVTTAEIQERDAENSISLLVHKLYFDILTAQAHLSAAQESVAAAATNEQESMRAVSEGRSLEVAALESHAAFLDQQHEVLTVQLSIDDLTLQLDDVLGLPLGTRLNLDPNALGNAPALPSRTEAISAVKEHNPKVLTAQQAVEKAKAGVSAARAAYIPDISGIARQSYQSGVPFLVHNFGTFGGVVTYDLFDGGAREAQLRQAKIQLAMAETQLAQTESDVSIAVAAAYDKVEQLDKLVAVATEALKAREEAARINDKRFDQSAELASTVAKSHAAVFASRASLLEARLGLVLAEDDIQQMLGERP
ncbi:TolC family protein [Edaphobacter bradus]|uniref:TolC family protein n=1 Tax=Edaphobacter bradus TaxID=2259016 RepID=UPI0021DFBA34|nr:TolC family protein [Edaphobacter bradus]